MLKHHLVEPFPAHRFKIFTAAGQGGYVAEKAETESGWLFPVENEVVELGYLDMFTFRV